MEAKSLFAWNAVEGDICYLSGCDLDAYEPPLIVHSHSSFWNSITGGVVSRGSEIPDLCGVYLYSDFVGGFVRGLRYDGVGDIVEQRELSNVSSLSSFGYGETYEVYAVNHGSGTLLKVSPP